MIQVLLLKEPLIFKKGVQTLITSNIFIERVTWTLIEFIVDSLRRFPVCAKQSHRPFCISSYTSCPCCSQRWVGGIFLYRRTPCWTSIHHHPNGGCHVAADMSYKKGHEKFKAMVKINYK